LFSSVNLFFLLPSVFTIQSEDRSNWFLRNVNISVENVTSQKIVTFCNYFCVKTKIQLYNFILFFLS
jgi:hypothetical protein